MNSKNLFFLVRVRAAQKKQLNKIKKNLVFLAVFVRSLIVLYLNNTMQYD
jgi:hypothetical protein